MSSGWAIAAAVTIGFPIALIAYVRLSEAAVNAAARGARTAERMRVALWLIPAMIIIGTVLFYPLIQTIVLSLQTKDSAFTFDNYAWAVTDPAQVRSIVNSLLWVAVVPVMVLVVGLVFAVLSDRVRYEKLARLAIITPCAISMTASTIIWASIYRYSPPGTAQTGLANALYVGITGNNPIAWTIQQPLNNLALMLIGLWAWMGFAALLLSAAVKGIPVEIVEAARVDGVSEWQLFRHITFPQIVPTMGVVLTLLVVWALKVFDIVFVLTQGNYGTAVLGMNIYSQLFVNQNPYRGSTLAVILLVLALPIIWLNLRRIRRDVGV